jgi:hypothetical protein
MDYKDYLLEARILSQLTASGTLQQNGEAGRRNMTLLEMVRAMMNYAILPKSFCGYALDIATYFFNLVPSKFVHKTYVELWFTQKPSMRYIHIWDCLAPDRT